MSPRRFRAVAALVGLSAAIGASTACNAILGLPDVPVPVEAGPTSGGDVGDAAGVVDTSTPGSQGDASVGGRDGSMAVDGSLAKDGSVGADSSSVTVGFDASADAPGTVSEAGPPPVDSGPCNSTLSDTHNCGYCGHDCLGGQCLTGACQPVVLWPGDSGAAGQPYDLAQDDAYLYWIDISNHSVFRTNKTTGATNDLAPPADDLFPSGLAVDDAGAIYWGDTGEIYRCAKSGCAPDPVGVTTTVSTDVYSLAVDDENLYWSENSKQIFSAHKFGTGESPSVIWDGGVMANAVATDGTRVYFTASDGFLHGILPDGGSGFSIGAGGGAASLGVVLNGGSVYWTVDDTAHGEVWGATTSNLSPYGIATEQQFPTWLAADGTSVYWFTGTNSIINACTISDCTPTVVATSPLAHAIVVDDVAIYWTDPNALGNASGAIFKLAK